MGLMMSNLYITGKVIWSLEAKTIVFYFIMILESSNVYRVVFASTALQTGAYKSTELKLEKRLATLKCEI